MIHAEICKLATFHMGYKITSTNLCFDSYVIHTLTCKQHNIKWMSCPFLPALVLLQLNLNLWHSHTWLHFMQWCNCMSSLRGEAVNWKPPIQFWFCSVVVDPTLTSWPKYWALTLHCFFKKCNYTSHVIHLASNYRIIRQAAMLHTATQLYRSCLQRTVIYFLFFS